MPMPDNQTGQGEVTPWYPWAIGRVAIPWNGVGTILRGSTSFMPGTFLDGFFRLAE